MTLRHWPTGEVLQGQADSREALVCVHGIFSDRSAFTPFLEAAEPRLRGVELATFDYGWRRRLVESADDLLATLNDRYPSSRLVLVGHSMGGLVCRLAALQRGKLSIRLVFLLGTPNLGAFRTSQLGLLAQLTKSTVGTLWGLCTRDQGLLDLTRVSQIFAKFQHEKSYDPEVDYVSIPGCYFHEDRDLTAGLGELATVGFSALELFTVAATGHSPFWRVSLEKPHDGVVERSSNSLIPSSYGRRSEKDPTINDTSGRQAPTYAHVELFPACGELLHVRIHRDPQIIDLVLEIAASTSLDAWLATADQRGGGLRVFTRNPRDGPF